jgi:hypothetical protein
MRAKAMQHFSLEEWTDFANRNVTADERRSMQQHLETGCSRCSHVLLEWQSLKDFAFQELENEAPRHAVAFVEAAFRNLNPRRAPDVITTLAHLVFDTFHQAAFAGVRHGPVDSRCLLYRAGPLFIDLNLDLTQSSGHIALQGQVMDSDTKTKGIEEIPVMLQSGQETLARTLTDEFGEFELECEARKGLQISLAVNPQKNVLIVLDESVWAARQTSAAE